MGRLAAYAVHLFTASGAVLALLAMTATIDGRLDVAFGWLGVALVVDGLDGTFARRFRTRDRIAWIDGDVLDLVVDYATYVFVPAVMLLRGSFLPPGTEPAAAALVCVTGALYFADRRMKTAEADFRGFPALWNLVVFALAVFRPPAWVALASVGALGVAQFLPVAFLHPVRRTRLRPLNLAVTVLTAAAAGAALLSFEAPPFWAKAALAAGGLWLAVAGELLRRKPLG